VRKILQLEGRRARLRRDYQGGLARLSPLWHRARQVEEEARELKVKLTDCERTELRRVRSGV